MRSARRSAAPNPDELGRAALALVDPGTISAPDTPAARAGLITAAHEVLAAWRIGLSAEAAGALVAEAADRLLGFGPLDALLADPQISDIVLNGPHAAHVERGGLLHAIAPPFADEAALTAMCRRIAARAGRRVDAQSPIAEVALPCGARATLVLPPVAVGGPHLAIRRFVGPPPALGALGLLSEAKAAMLAGEVAARRNILVTGGAGTGKTTLLSALIAAVPTGERTVICEDVAELRTGTAHVARLQTRAANLDGAGEIPMPALLRAALRLRPDRIVIGEVRGGEAHDLLQAMTTGHGGSMGTLHASGPAAALLRLEALVAMAGLGLGAAATRRLVGEAVDLIVHLARGPGGVREAACCARVMRSASNATLDFLWGGL